MTRRCRYLCVLSALLASIPWSPRLDGGDRMSPELLFRLGRLGATAVAPDGMSVAYAVRWYRLTENKGYSQIRIIDLGSRAERLLLDELSNAGDLSWVRTPRGDRLFWIGSGDGKAPPQVWSIDPAGGERSQVTDVATGIGSMKLSPRGDRIAYSTRVKVDPTIHDLHPDLPLANAQIHDSLMFRHWDRWRDGTYDHLHVASIGDDGRAAPGVDLLERLPHDSPMPPFGGSEGYDWSPDGREIAFAAKIVSNPAESTDSDIYLYELDAPAEERRLLCATAGLDGYDRDPVYSPDGRHIGFHSMARPGFEADRSRVLLFDRSTREIRAATKELDLSAEHLRWSPDSQAIYFESDQLGARQLYRTDLASRETLAVTEGWFNHGLQGLSPDGTHLIIARMNIARPPELYIQPSSGGEVVALSDINGEFYRDIELPRVRERFVRATDGRKIHNWVILPPDWDPSRKYPMLTYCQGGPQSQVGQWFSYRWNFHLMAARGYVVLGVNRRGLPGFGQDWNDEISGDWGGQAMRDILAATDSMLTEPWIDARRVAAVGASFGGYTAYWLMGKHEGRFAAIVSHCGVFHLESMYASTEELFFVNWDLGGPCWRSDEIRNRYESFSPHRFVGNWKTPLLVIHGEKDFRVPVTQGIQAFTAAQVQGVPSRFLYFPEEGHWVLSPQNGVLWHRVFFDWLDRWCSDPGASRASNL
jgi:dipeptidyl aminopeptidase/acylaminoacyl peptidase